MIPTLVIALREGVEASLIIGIIAAFLVKEGRRDAMRQMWAGVAVAIALCVGIAVILRVVGQELPQRQQEGLETVIGLIAVSAVTYMIVWMRRNARGIKKVLEGNAANALASGSTMALVAMAFLAVLREGFETSVFLLAAFNDASDTTAAGAGAVLGLLAAVAIGIGIYRGGVHINLTRFFRVTGLILVFVAAGLLATSLHTAHEAGWFNTPAGAGGRPDLAGPARHDLRLAADRDAGTAAEPHRRRGRDLPALRGADGALRALAGPPAGAAAPGSGSPGGSRRASRLIPLVSPR